MPVICPCESALRIDSLALRRDSNIWGVATDAFVIAHHLQTEPLVSSPAMSYQWNNGGFTNVDVPMQRSAPLNFEIVSTTGLPDGLNRCAFAPPMISGRTGVVVDGFRESFPTPPASQTVLVTQMEYRFDGGAFTPRGRCRRCRYCQPQSNRRNNGFDRRLASPASSLTDDLGRSRTSP
jgi:hypothetical protein